MKEFKQPHHPQQNPEKRWDKKPEGNPGHEQPRHPSHPGQGPKKGGCGC